MLIRKATLSEMILILWLICDKNMLAIAKLESIPHLRGSVKTASNRFVESYKYRQVTEQHCYLRSPNRLNPECKLLFFHVSEVRRHLLSRSLSRLSIAVISLCFRRMARPSAEQRSLTGWGRMETRLMAAKSRCLPTSRMMDMAAWALRTNRWPYRSRFSNVS